MHSLTFTGKKNPPQSLKIHFGMYLNEELTHKNISTSLDIPPVAKSSCKYKSDDFSS